MSSTISNSHQVPAALQDLASGYIKTQALYVAARLGLADHLSAGPQSSEALAQAVSAHPQALDRLLRALESLGLLRSPQPGVFALTPLGEHLCTDAPSGFRSQMLMLDETGWLLWGHLTYTITTGHSPVEHVFALSSFDFFQQQSQTAARYNEFMTRRVSALAPTVVAAYDFRPFRTITQIAGGHGTLLTAILEAAPEAQGVLFELPMTVEAARQHLAERGLAERCTCVGGNYFIEVPHGDAILLLGVISNWDDEKSVRILTNCRRRIGAQGRLLLLEQRFLPEEPASPTAWLDLMKLVSGGGLRRSEAEYRRLLGQADFELLRVIPTKTELSLFEARPV